MIDLLNPYYIYKIIYLSAANTSSSEKMLTNTWTIASELFPLPISSLQHWRHLGWPLLSLLAVIRAALTWVFRGLDESSGKGLDLMGGGALTSKQRLWRINDLRDCSTAHYHTILNGYVEQVSIWQTGKYMIEIMSVCLSVWLPSAAAGNSRPDSFQNIHCCHFNCKWMHLIAAHYFQSQNNTLRNTSSHGSYHDNLQGRSSSQRASGQGKQATSPTGLMSCLVLELSPLLTRHV